MAFEINLQQTFSSDARERAWYAGCDDAAPDRVLCTILRGGRIAWIFEVDSETKARSLLRRSGYHHTKVKVPLTPPAARSLAA